MTKKIRNILLFVFVIFLIYIAAVLPATIISNSHIYEAETLTNKTGEILESSDASGGFQRFFSSDESGFVIFGPYVKIPVGDYFASFRLKTDSKYSQEPIAILDVFSLGTGEINKKKIYAKDFKYSNLYQSFVVQFKSDGNSNIEFRINKSIGSNLWVDSITISTLDNFSIYKSMFVQTIKIIVFIIVGLIVIMVILRSKTTRSIVDSKHFHFSVKIEKFLFVFVLFVYIMIVLGLVGQVHITNGDEPHYLITVHSIVEDGDIYLENNYINKDYMIFFPFSYIDPHISLDKYGRWLPPHGIGFPILLTVPYFLFGLLGIRLFLSFIAALLVVNTFLLIKESLKNEKIAFATSIFISFTSPLLFYSHTIYPETVAALILVYSTRVLFKTYNKQFTSRYNYILCGILMAYLPWLGIKYIVLMIPLTILFLVYSKKEKTEILVPIVISSLLYIVFMFKIFNSLVQYGSDFNTGNFFPIANLFSPAKIASYFFDQQVGLIFYAPIYVLSIVGIALFIKHIKSKKYFEKFLILLLPSIFYLSMYVMSISWGQGCPPGRSLVAILPSIAFLLAIGLSFFCKKKMHIVTGVLCVISFGVAFVLLENPDRLFNNWTDSRVDVYGRSNLLIHIGGSPFIDVAKIFPSFLTKSSWDNWIYLLFWIGLFSIMVTIEYTYRLKNIKCIKKY